jgi:sulfate adenylyltransferase subunit 1
MNARVPDEVAVDRGVLRFITAGSVDDGKSTLIGRLLYDTRSIHADQIAALARAGQRRAANRDAIDLSLLTDGLEAEREQGITIDVAYRYFATARRKFIIADTPGHEQYTRNMVTGASTADAAVILIDATRVVNGALLSQTRRHTALARLLGIRHLLVAVNKMDLLDFSEDAFGKIVAAYADLAQRLDVEDFTAVPVSALDGDNLVELSPRTPWFAGPSVLDWLESVPSVLDDDSAHSAPLRFAVQCVLRGYADSEGGVRGYAGRVASGSLTVGQSLRVMPAGSEACVAVIETYEGRRERAVAGESVAVRLDREIDLSRGDWLVDIESAPQLALRWHADLAWLDSEALQAGRKYLLRHGTQTVPSCVRTVREVLDLENLSWQAVGNGVGANDIAHVVVETQRLLPADTYDQLRASGAFVLIDGATNRTVAAGMIRGVARE